MLALGGGLSRTLPYLSYQKKTGTRGRDGTFAMDKGGGLSKHAAQGMYVFVPREAVRRTNTPLQAKLRKKKRGCVLCVSLHCMAQCPLHDAEVNEF